MLRLHPLRDPRCYPLLLGVGAVAALALLAPTQAKGGQNPPSPKAERVLPPPTAVKDGAALTTLKQKDDPKKAKLDKTRLDAAELSALADQLRDELNKLNAHILPIDVIQKTEKVERLAKKIKGEANE